MPVTAKLSKAFYERFGDDLANELVDWFNQVDATYRSDLRDLNELNFARFDAKLEQRVAELNARLDFKIAGLETRIESRFARLDAKIESNVAELHAKIAGLDAKIESRIAAVYARIDEKISEVRLEIHTAETRILRWMFASWITIFGMLVAVLQLNG